jgi:hypothetical protein
VRQCDPERRGLGREAVGHGQRIEAALDRKRVDRHLRALHELLDERRGVARGLQRRFDRRRQLPLVANDAQAALSLPVGRFHDGGHGEPCFKPGDKLPAGLGDPRSVEPLPLPGLGDGEARNGWLQRMRNPVPGGDAGCDADGPVDPRSDDPVDPFGRDQALDPALVLGRDDRAARS